MTEVNYRIYLDPQYPLLEDFRKIAPGSFKHCQNVRNICESVATELGLDVERLACAALYHDVGKINNPNFFIENQDGNNPHDSLDPRISYHIITRHIADSVLELVRHDFPYDIIKLVSQHHGDTVLKPFFDKSGSDVEDEWRYKCSKADSTEAAILLVVDCVEATARAAFMGRDDVTKDDIQTVIDSKISFLENDQQLDDLKIGIMRVVRAVLCREIEAMYHKRIEYTEDKKTSRRKKDTKEEELPA